MSIDWTVFDKYPESTCYCRCEAVFRSHAKFAMDPFPHTVTRRPCPACGKDDDCRRISSDPETMTISGAAEKAGRS